MSERYWRFWCDVSTMQRIVRELGGWPPPSFYYYGVTVYDNKGTSIAAENVIKAFRHTGSVS